MASSIYYKAGICDIDLPPSALAAQEQNETPNRWVKIRAHYDDLWETPTPLSNLLVTVNNEVFKQSAQLNPERTKTHLG